MQHFGKASEHMSREAKNIQKEDYMRRALVLAGNGCGHTSPNPMVGCVIVKNDRIIGEGWHAYCGGLHAERNALKNCTEDPSGMDRRRTWTWNDC